MAVYFNLKTHELSTTAEAGQVQSRLPDEVGIIWADDQSMNQLTFDLDEADYTFDPEDDLVLLSEYIDQLIEMM